MYLLPIKKYLEESSRYLIILMKDKKLIVHHTMCDFHNSADIFLANLVRGPSQITLHFM